MVWAKTCYERRFSVDIVLFLFNENKSCNFGQRSADRFLKITFQLMGSERTVKFILESSWSLQDEFYSSLRSYKLKSYPQNTISQLPTKITLFVLIK